MLKMELKKTLRHRIAVMLTLMAFVCPSGFAACKELRKDKDAAYERAKQIGMDAAMACRKMIEGEAAGLQRGGVVVMTNAGYAEIEGICTQGALDGIGGETGASRGRNTLVEIQSAPWAPLWFAVFDVASGYCAYTEAETAVSGAWETETGNPLFRRKAVARIDAEYVFDHPEETSKKFSENIFGGNEFRILTIANAVAAGAPGDAIRAFEFHDHYCPGVTSGIIMARYVKKHFASMGGGYFVHAVSPWCKEDALMVLLNATPGKRGYAVSYPTDGDLERRAPEALDADTIVYRENTETGRWEGRVLSFRWALTSCRETGNTYVDKLCADLWYLAHMDTPDAFITVVKAFELPEGVTPQEWAGPGVDPLERLGLTKKN